jgi:lysyl-tRNA synthetase class 2
LRISLELPLKRLLVAGYEKVYEIGRIFRNEGIDQEHLQDYTQVEFYLAYADYKDLMRLVQKMYKKIILSTLGTLVHNYGGHKIDWSKKWPQIEYYKIFKEMVGLDLKKATEDDLLREIKKRGFQTDSTNNGLGRGRLIDFLYKKIIRPSLIEPCMLVNPPADLEPLAKRIEKSLDRVERFQIVAAGTELGKGFSENNDPIYQRLRFKEQMALRDAGDKEAQRLDEDFLESLEYGMPPSAGFGMSERLFAVLMDKPVRESVIFPLMKRKNG